MRRLMPAALAVVFAAVPIFPSFIALTSVAFPGISLLPRAPTLALLGLCGVLAIYALVMLWRYGAGEQPMLVPLLGVFGATVAAALLGFDPRGGLVFTGIVGLGVVWHCSVVRFYDDPSAASAIFASFLLSGGVAAAAAIVMVVTRVPVLQYVIQHGRATGTFILPGELAGYLIFFLPLAYALGRVAHQRALRAVAWIAVGTGLLALALTYSRAGWMGFAAAAAFLVAAQTRRLRHGAGAAAAVVVAGIVAVGLLFNAHHNPSEDYTRLGIWQTAEQIIDRFPLTGVGPFQFSRLYAILRLPDADATAFHAHSVYLTFFAELGLVGICAVAWAMWRFAAALRARIANASAPAALLALSIAAGLVGVAVQGLIDTVSVVIFGLWLPMMGLALAAAKDRSYAAGPDR
jgi:O-antigen ligase